MTRSALRGWKGPTLLVLLALAPISSVRAAGFGAQVPIPEGRATPEAAVLADAAPMRTPATRFEVPGGRDIEWVVSGSSVSEPADDEATSMPRSSVSSRLNFRSSGAEASWTCSVDLVGSDPHETLMRERSSVLVGLSTSALSDTPVLRETTRLDLEWSGSASSHSGSAGLAGLKSMIGEAEVPHSGKVEARLRWKGAVLLSAGRAWERGDSERAERQRLGLRKGIAGKGWAADVGGQAWIGYRGRGRDDGVSLDVSARIKRLRGAAVTAAARYERRYGARSQPDRASLHLAADLSDVLASGVSGVLQPRLLVRASASAATPRANTRSLRLEEVRGQVQMGWRF